MNPIVIDLTLEDSIDETELSTVTLSPDQKIQRFLDTTCIDIQRYIESYLQISELRKYCVYTKYDYKTCISAMKLFTTSEINEHFHGDDYFGMSHIKDKTIQNYLQFNLMSSYFPIVCRRIDQWHLIENSWYINLRKIVICSKYRTKSTAIKMLTHKL
jgi:hypothetical protein